jgi:hypothetical protein
MLQFGYYPYSFPDISPHIHQISQLLGDLDCVLGTLLKKSKKLLLSGDGRRFKQVRQFEQREASFASKTKRSEAM